MLFIYNLCIFPWGCHRNLVTLFCTSIQIWQWKCGRDSEVCMSFNKSHGWYLKTEYIPCAIFLWFSFCKDTGILQKIQVMSPLCWKRASKTIKYMLSSSSSATFLALSNCYLLGWRHPVPCWNVICISALWATQSMQLEQPPSPSGNIALVGFPPVASQSRFYISPCVLEWFTFLEPRSVLWGQKYSSSKISGVLTP